MEPIKSKELIMITVEAIECTLKGISNYQKLADVHLLKKAALNKKMELLSDQIKMYCADSFNEEKAESIERRQCEVAGSYDTTVNFTTGVVIVTTDDPVSRHPYDTTSMAWRVSELLEDLKFLERIEDLTL